MTVMFLLIFLAEMTASGKFKPLSLNRVWKAIQILVQPVQTEKSHVPIFECVA